MKYGVGRVFKIACLSIIFGACSPSAKNNPVTKDIYMISSSQPLLATNAEMPVGSEVFESAPVPGGEVAGPDPMPLINDGGEVFPPDPGDDMDSDDVADNPDNDDGDPDVDDGPIPTPGNCVKDFQKAKIAFDTMTTPPHAADYKYKNMVGNINIVEADKVELDKIRGDINVAGAENLKKAHKVTGNLMAITKKAGHIHNVHGNIDINSNELEHVHKNQGDIQIVSRSIRHIHKVYGTACVSTQKAGHFHDVRGALTVYGRDEGGKQATVDHIHKVRGPLYLQDLKIKHIHDVRGDITLINCTVEHLDKFRGNVTLINSTIKKQHH